jgi:hypothetical protein
MPRRRDKSKEKEIRSLVETLAERHPWLDADMLDSDDDFERLVELLGSEDHVPDSAFAEAARAPNKHLRAGALEAIAEGRPAPSGWPEWAAGRFERAEWGERQLLLRALAVCEGRLMLEILGAAEEGWNDAPIIQEVAPFVDARIAAGEAVTAEELGELDARLQPVVDEVLRSASERTRAAFLPAMQEWRRSFVDVTFFTSRRPSGPASTCRARAGSSTRCSRSSSRATSSSARSTRSRTSSSSNSDVASRASSRSCV